MKQELSLFIILTFPYVESFQELEGFDENSYPICDDKGIEEYGSFAYFVKQEWYLNNITEYDDDDKAIEIDIKWEDD